MAYGDVRQMLLVARNGMPVTTWRSEAALGTRLLHGDWRTTQLRYALAILRPREGVIHDDDGFLTDLAGADPATGRDLVYARYFASVPLAVTTARSVLQPILQRGERVIARGVLTAMLDEELAALSAATRARSCSAIVTEFARAGVLRADRPARAPLELTGRVPSALALLHLLQDDLRDRQEATDTWLATSSLAATIFAVPPALMREQIEMLVAGGRLRRSYYGGEPRILAA